MTTPDFEQDDTVSAPDPERWIDARVVDGDGHKLGKVADVYLDRDTGKPEWLLVQTGLLGNKETFVALAGAITEEDVIRVAYSKDQVKDAPSVDAGAELTPEEEDRLHEHYGLAGSVARADTGFDGRDIDGRDIDGRDIEAPRAGRAIAGRNDTMPRSVEQPRVGAVRRPSELVRLRKYVVTEPVTATVYVEREEVRLESEPVTDEGVERGMSGPDLSGDEHQAVGGHEGTSRPRRRIHPRAS